MLFPLAVLAITIVMYVLAMLYVGDSDLSFKTLRKFFRQLCISLFMLFYTYEVVTVAEPFACAEQANGEYLMYSAPSLKCFDDQWMGQFFYLMLYVGFYLILIPLFALYLFLSHRGVSGMQILRDKYGPLIVLYKPRMYYWELVLILKRLLFSSALNFFSVLLPSYIHRFLALSILFFFFLLDILIFPYRSVFGNQCNLLWSATSLIYLIANNVVLSSRVLTVNQRDFLCFFLICLVLYGLWYSFGEEVRALWSRCRHRKVPQSVSERVEGAGAIWGEGVLRAWLSALR
jgi:hypothetical protein